MRCSCRSLSWPSGVGTGTAAPASQDWRDGSDQFRWESPAPSNRHHGSRSPCWSPASSSKRVGGGRAPIRVCLRYLLTVLVVFAAVNLPFLAWHPGAWWHGTLIPLTGGLVADGQGLVTLATHGLTGGVNLTMLSLAGALAMVGGVAAFVAWYPQLKRIWPLLLTIPFFFSPRSLSSYLVDLFPVALVAALSVDGVPRDASEDDTAWRDLLARPSVLVVAVIVRWRRHRVVHGLQRATSAAVGAQRRHVPCRNASSMR